MSIAAIALLSTFLGGQPQSSGTPSSGVSEIVQARSLLQAGMPSLARELYKAILSVDASNSEAQQGMVEASERLALDARAHGDTDTALRVLMSAQLSVPNNPRLLFDLAVLEEGMNLFTDADQTVVKLQALGGLDEPKVLYLAARIKLDLGQLEVAENQMRTYLVMCPDDASAHYGLGRIFQLGQQLDQAKTEFLRSLELEPQQTESYYQLGEIALAQARYEDAIRAFAKTLARNQSHGGALTGTGIALLRLRLYDKAAETLQIAVAAAPSYQPAHYFLGLSLGRLGRKAESERELARAAELAQADNQHDAQRLRIRQLPPSINNSAPQPF